METLLKSITREPTGTTISDVLANAVDGDEVSILFKAVREQQEQKPLHISGEDMRKGHEYIVRVVSWMTKVSDERGNFMRDWNKNVPMPFRVMRGRVLSETRAMLYMELRACTLRTDYCMKCGKPLSHPVSRLYGLGPECGRHHHINPFETEAELQEALTDIRRTLNDITWTGWIPKFGVEYATEVLPNGNVATR